MTDDREVIGRVAFSDSRPVAGVLARAYAITLTDEQLLAEAATGDDGRYQITLGGGPPVNLRVRLFAPDNRQIAASSVFFRSSGSVTVDLVVDDDADRTSEFERYVAAVQPTLNGVPMARLGPEGIGYLSGDLDIPAARLEALSNAVRREAEPRPGLPTLPAAVWYGWQRTGFDPGAPAALWGRPLADLLAAVRTAVEQRLVPPVPDDGELESAVRAHRLEFLLDRPHVGESSLRDLLRTLPEPLAPDIQRSVAGVLVDDQPPPERLVESLGAAGVDAARAAAVARTLELADVTAGHAALVAALQQVDSLAAVRQDEWADLAFRHGVPAGVLDPVAYAATVQAAVETREPSATLAARLADGTVSLAIPGGDRVGAFLEANPAFDVRSPPTAAEVERMAAGRRRDDEAVGTVLTALRRLAPVTRTWGDVSALLELGLRSPFDVAAREPEWLATALWSRMPEADARDLHARAVIVQAATVALVGALRQGASPGAAALPVTTPSPAALAGHPTLAALFGSLDQCSCGQCRSVLGPSAYLVDLLEYLHDGSPQAYAELMARRPDVADVELSCANAQQEVPAIDLALEILENAVALPLTVGLPAGTDITAILSAPTLPQPVLDVLRRTALDVSGDLRPVREPEDRQLPGSVAWTVADATRRWTLQQTAESLLATPPGGRRPAQPLATTGLDLAAVLGELDQGTLPEELDRRLRTAVSTDPLLQPALTSAGVEVLEPGRRWRVAYDTALEVRVGTPVGGDVPLTLAGGGGAVGFERTYSAGAVDATAAALNAGEPGGMVAVLLQEPRGLAVEALADDAWRLTRERLEIDLAYTPSWLTVMALTYQSDDRADAGAAPRNRNPESYRRLADAIFPWSLPFDLPAVETRALLARAGVTRGELAARWASSTATDDLRVALEDLGLSFREVQLIITPFSPPTLWRAWGLTQQAGDDWFARDASVGEGVSGPPLDVLARVSIVLQQARISHSQLLDLLDTDFVRGAGPAPVTLPVTECRPSAMRLEPVDEGLYDRLHRFIRLWRRLGWSIVDTDLAVRAFQQDGDISGSTLIELAQLGRLRGRLGLPAAQLSSWWGGLDTRRRRAPVAPLYDGLFGDPGAAGFDPDFALNATRTALAVEATPAPPLLGDKLAGVAAAFGARANDLAVLLAALPLRPGESQPLPLTLDTLSRLWRVASLARALRLGAADLVQAVRVTGIEPFPVTAAVGARRPRPTLEFCAAVQLLGTSRLTLAEVAYVLRHETRPDGSPGLGDPAIADLLAGVRSAMAAAAADVGGADAEPAEQLRVALAALGWYPELVDSVIAELPGETSVPVTGGVPVLAELRSALGDLEAVGLDGASLAAADFVADGAWDDLRAAVPATASAAARTAWEGALDALAARQAQLREQLGRRLLSARLPEFSAQTGVVDPAVALPAGLRGRCRTEPSDDGAGSRIVVTGWVDPEDGAALRAALGAAHAAAVAELRAVSDAYRERATAARLLSPAEVGALLNPGAERYPRLLAAVARHRTIGAAIAQVAQAFALPPEIAGDLLLDLLAVPGTQAPAVEVLLDPAFAGGDPVGRPNATVFPAVFALIRRLHKVALLTDRLGLDRVTLRALAGTGPEPARRAAGVLGLDLSALPAGLPDTDSPAGFLGFRRLMALVRLRAAAPSAAATLAYAAAVLDLDRTADQRQAAALAVLADAFDAPTATVAAAGARVFLFGLTYDDPLGIEAVAALVTVLLRLGARPGQVPELIALEPTAAGAELARSLLRGRYGEATWAEVVRPVSDELRVHQRDALVDHLVATRELVDSNAVYEHLLMDVLTGPCLPTTRILQATATVQLFVDRCLQNLEQLVPAASLNRARWEWMRTYRVWEANRRVFLWPQNWLHPELREDSSPAFRRVQSALGQDELTDERAHEALLGYLDDVVELAQLAVVGMFQHQRDGGGSDLYVVGRTAEPPLRHFWRVCENVDGPDPRWRPWEPVDLDIGGTHVMPFVLDGNLHLAWPVLRRLQSGTDVTWELQLASARRTSRGWSQKTVSRDVVRTEGLVSKDERGTFTFGLGVEQVLPPASTSAAASLVTIVAEKAAVVTCYAAKDLQERILPRPDSTRSDPGPVRLNLTVRALVSTMVGGQTVHWYAAGTRVTGTLTGAGLPSVTVALAIGAGGEATMTIDPSALAAVSGGVDPVRLALFTTQLLIGSLTLEFRYLNLVTTRNLQLATLTDPSRTWKANVVFAADESTPVPPAFLDPERAVRWQPLGSFVLTASGGTTFEPGRQPQLYRRAWPQVHFENGIREPLGRTDDDGFALGGRSGFLHFESTPGRYVAVPANPHEDVPGLQYTATEADVWHYRDGAGQYYIQSSAYGGFRLDADGHPLASYLRRQGARDRRALYDPVTQAIGDGGSLLRDVHRPTPALDPASRTAQGIVFDQRAPYGPYNWELFLHLPLLVAGQLARQQRFEDAEAWLRLVFDPTSTDARATYPPDPARYWRFLPFRNGPRPDRIEDLLSWLANPTDQHPVQDFVAQIAHWRDNPFRPHEIARIRPGAYQWQVLFAYLDLLLDYGDERFRRDTRESLVEATMLYVRAAELLGSRPRTVEPQLRPPPLTYRALIGRWDEFSDAWYSLADTPLAQALLAWLEWLREHGVTGPAGIPDADAAIAALRTAGLTYFCVPPNDRLTGYWDRVADRLFKIRHCQNIDGVERDLPLFEPPIDPDLLVRAVVAGIDIGEAVAGLTAPLLPQRFAVLSARARTLCAEVRSLGQVALGALQSRDAERLAQLRAGHERALVELVEDVRREQATEAHANVDALLATRESVASRYRHLQYLLTGSAVAAPQRGTPAVEAPSRLSLAPPGVLAADERDLGLVTPERDQLGWQQAAGTFALASGISNGVAAVFFAAGTWLVSAPLQGFGHAANAVGFGLGTASANATHQAGRGGLIGGYQRRTDDWTFQSNSALRELAQIDRQLTAAELRAAIADNELTNHQQQVAHAREVESFMRDKYTNQQLYDWMSGELATTYFGAYQLALDAARRAEQALRYELYQPEASFIRPRYWDSLHKGLLAGEQLEQDLRRMEAAHVERDRREHELTRRVSLHQLDPLALLELRATGRCTFSLPEMLFDLDVPGHFLRRLKSVSLGLPAVAGPNVGAHCRLTLLASTVRHSSEPGEAYARGDDDLRFTDDRALTESVVTSGILDDSGVWEPSLRDERRMPFERRGAISSWRLELPGEFRQFDYESISDVVLTVRYSAREGGERLRAAAVDALAAVVARAEGTPLALLVSLRHQFPNEWARLVAPQAGTRRVTVPIPRDRFPFVFAGRALTVRAVDVFSVPRGPQPPLASPEVSGPPAATPTDLGLSEAAAPAPVRRRHAEGLALAVPADGASAGWTVSTTAAVAQGLRDVVLVLTYTAALPDGAAVPPIDALVRPATPEEEALLGRAQVGDAAAAFTLGLRLRDRGDEQADAWLLRGAELGDVAAAYTYGRRLWERGDSAAAEPWLRSAAEGGDVAAAGVLGSLLADTGRRGEAREWLERSAAGGDAFAAERLARMRADG